MKSNRVYISSVLRLVLIIQLSSIDDLVLIVSKLLANPSNEAPQGCGNQSHRGHHAYDQCLQT